MNVPTKVLAAALAGVVAALWGCGEGTGRPGDAPDFSGAEWTATEELRIGSVDDPVYGLTAVTAAAVGPDGTVYTLHRQPPFLRRWSEEGTHLADLGGQGEGPGEFDSPRRLGFFGDTLWVSDRNWRLTLFGLDGTLLGTVSPDVDLGEAGMDPSALPARPEAPLRDGTWWGRMPAFSDAVAAGDLTRLPYVRMTADGETLDTIWVRPIPDRGRHQTLAVEWDGGGSYSTQPLADTPLPVVDENRLALYVVERWAAAGDAARGEWTLHRFGMSGDTVWSRSVTHEPEPVPASITDSLLAVMEERFSSLAERTNLTPARISSVVRESLYRPSHYPPVETALVGRDGTVWVALRAADDAETRVWRVFGEDGADLARVHLPTGVRVLSASRSTVWGSVTDELHIPYLVRFRMGG